MCSRLVAPPSQVRRAGRGRQETLTRTARRALPSRTKSRGDPGAALRRRTSRRPLRLRIAAAIDESTAVIADASEETTQIGGSTPPVTKSRRSCAVPPAAQQAAPHPGRLARLPLVSGRGRHRPHDLGPLHGHEHRRLHEPGRADRQGSRGDQEPQRLRRRPGRDRDRPAAARDGRAAGAGAVLCGAHHLRRGRVHHQGRPEGAEHAAGLRSVAEDQSTGAREDRRSAAW